MTTQLAHITHAENIRSKLLLDGQIVLHDIGIRILQGLSLNHAGNQIVLDANVGERSANHDFVIAAAGAVRIKIGRFHTVIH